MIQHVHTSHCFCSSWSAVTHIPVPEGWNLNWCLLSFPCTFLFIDTKYWAFASLESCSSTALMNLVWILQAPALQMHTEPHWKYGYLILQLALFCLVLSFLNLCFTPTTVHKCLMHLGKKNSKKHHIWFSYITQKAAGQNIPHLIFIQLICCSFKKSNASEFQAFPSRSGAFQNTQKNYISPLTWGKQMEETMCIMFLPFNNSLNSKCISGDLDTSIGGWANEQVKAGKDISV